MEVSAAVSEKGVESISVGWRRLNDDEEDGSGKGSAGGVKAWMGWGRG
jgi:hypothetical protein